MTAILVLSFVALGGIAGYLLKVNTKFQKIINKITTILILLLLFLLGISVGANQQVIQNIQSIWFQALLLSLGGIVGSILMVSSLKFFFNKK